MSTRTLAAALACAAVLGLAGCGGGSGSTGGQPPTVTQVAGQIGATGLKPYPGGPFARDAASAYLRGRAVVIAVFSDDAGKQAYIRTVEAFGQKPLEQGTDYVVFPG